MGVSVENRPFMHRIDHLRQTGAHVKFLSLEPLLGPAGYAMLLSQSVIMEQAKRHDQEKDK